MLPSVPLPRCDIEGNYAEYLNAHGEEKPTVLAGMSPSATNVRFGSKADIPHHTHLCPLLGVKRTSNVRYSALAALMSAFGGKAEVLAAPLSGPWAPVSRY